MAAITLDGIEHHYEGVRPGQAPALKRLSHVWEDGGAYALLGPSGCGKTTMLNIISGLVRPTHGRVLFDGRDTTDLPTERRNIAQVFQFPVLYDTMTVRENLAFPLKARRVDPALAARRVQQIADLLELGPYLDRRPGGLGAGEKQKISLGRGLVRSDVAAILFDEPLTVVDPHVKFELRRKLKEIHAQFATTLVYVTHDQTEALTLADQVVVMNEGEIAQVGRPEDLYERPAHTFVGHFIGSPGMNFLPARRDGRRLQAGGHHWTLGDAQWAALSAQGLDRAGTLQLGIRPQKLQVVAPDAADALPAEVQDVEHLGQHDIVSARLADASLLRARVAPASLRRGERLGLRLPPQHALIYGDRHLLGAMDERQA